MTNSKFEYVNDWPRLIYAELVSHSDPKKAMSMAAYMKDNFAFLGVPKPLRAEIQRAHWPDRPRKTAAISTINELWKLPHREAQYVALDLVKSEAKYWTPEEALPHLESWITTHSWWDSVDALAVHGVGATLKRHLEAVWPTVQTWIYSDNLWLTRTAIIAQLGFRAATRTEWLDEALEAHTESKEFFHRKAIGWALRDYGKTNPKWVQQWVEAHPELSGLSRREALRLLGSREGA
ncbi:MAG: hypothetical protein RIR61_401 [Bacteroidota bacterium]|jgi:3-methyladenine DNA glycosylase AlkD